jgi:hypothetical protein
MPLFPLAALLGALWAPPAAVLELPPALRPAAGAEASARFHAHGGLSVVSRVIVPTEGADGLARAAWFARRFGPELGWPVELVATREGKSAHTAPGTAPKPAALERVRLEQRHEGLPVLDHTAVLSLDAEGNVRGVHSGLRVLRTVAPARIDAAAAIRLAMLATLKRFDEGIAAKASARPVVLANGEEGTHAFEVRVMQFVVRVDAAAGEVLSVRTGYME